MLGFLFHGSAFYRRTHRLSYGDCSSWVPFSVFPSPFFSVFARFLFPSAPACCPAPPSARPAMSLPPRCFFDALCLVTWSTAMSTVSRESAGLHACYASVGPCRVDGVAMCHPAEPTENASFSASCHGETFIVGRNLDISWYYGTGRV